MRERAVTHVLLDFFGTLADYAPSRSGVGCPRSHALARDLGARVSYREFDDAWEAEWARFEERASADGREFPVTDVTAAFLERLLGRPPAPEETAALVETYVAEWNDGVSYPPGVAETVAALAARFQLAVVSNTHHVGLVQAHAAAMGIASQVEVIVTSIEVGWRKPHPAIYADALGRLGASPGQAVFAGDTYLADYAGPVAAGMTAYLIDPAGRHEVPAHARLRSIHDLPGRLGG